MTVNYQWPEHYPDDVPPDHAVPADGHVYRLVGSIPPTENDFLSTREEHPARTYKNKREGDSAFGVSVFNKKERAAKKQLKYGPLAEKVIVQGKLVPQLGKISEKAKKGHITLWKCVGSAPHKHIKDSAE